MSPPDLAAAVAALDGQLHPWIHAHTAPESRLRALQQELAWAVEVATVDPAFLAEYHATMPVPGATDRDYRNRWLPVGDDLQVLAGPRFRGLDPRRPFVAIDSASRALRPDDLDALRRTLPGHFARFAPLALVFWSSAAVGAWPGAAGDARFVAGSLGDLRRRPLPAGVSARTPSDPAFPRRYVDAMERMLAAEPHRREWTRAEEPETMRRLLAEGTVREVIVDGEWAGVVAAEPAARFGLHGASVVELLLLPAHRGRGLGAALSLLLAHAVPFGDDAFLHGTIHHRNVAALRAASRAGRVDLAGEVVVPVDPG